MISVVIPTMNEEEGIKKTLENLKKSLRKHSYDYEVVVVDGGSKDKTREIAEEKGAYVVLEERKGYGRAYKTGFHIADGEIIATMDGDDSYPAENTHKLIKQLKKEKLDFITTNRFGRIKEGAMSPKHKLGNTILNITQRTLFKNDIKDSQSGMWVFRKKILNKLDLKNDGMPFSEEIKIEAFSNPDIRAKEVPIEYRERVGEVEISSWEDGLKNFFYLFKKKIENI